MWLPPPPPFSLHNSSTLTLDYREGYSGGFTTTTSSSPSNPTLIINNHHKQQPHPPPEFRAEFTTEPPLSWPRPKEAVCRARPAKTKPPPPQIHP